MRRYYEDYIQAAKDGGYGFVRESANWRASVLDRAAPSQGRSEATRSQLRNRAWRRGVQVGTMDTILAQLCIRYELQLLTTDVDFTRIAEHETLEHWTPKRNS